ncbi:HDOD domain-containing protein [Thermodesulfovibrio hydrogeniphilus]
MQQKIEEIINRTLDIASHYKIVGKVVKVLENEFATMDELQDILSRDKGFTARFLRIANSPYYGMSRKIKTVKEAIILLGVNTAKSLILSTSLIYLFKKMDSFEQKLWQHGLAVGISASLLANITELATPEESLSCGILHDIGKVLLNNAMPDVYPKIYEKYHDTKKSSIELENEILGINHVEVGVAIAEKWNFPELIKDTIKYHHYVKCASNGNDSESKNICKLIRVSDQICNELGYGLKKPEVERLEEEFDADKKIIQEIRKNISFQLNQEMQSLMKE